MVLTEWLIRIYLVKAVFIVKNIRNKLMMESQNINSGVDGNIKEQRVSSNLQYQPLCK